MLATSAVLSLLLLSPQADAQAKAVWDAWLQRLGSVESVTGKLEIVPQGTRQNTWTFQLLKPGKFKIVSANQQFVSDGKQTWMLFPAEKSYMAGGPGGPPLLNGFEAFYGKAAEKQMPTAFRMEQFEGKSVAVAELKPREDISVQTLLDVDTKQPIAWKQVMSGRELVAKYADLKFNVPIAAQETVFALPQGYSERKAPDYMANLLKVGSQAPDFTLKLSDGATTSLKDQLKGNKAVLLNFWFYG